MDKNSAKFSITQKFSLEIDPDLLVMSGSETTKMSMPGLSESYTEYFSEDLPEGMDGSSTLALQCSDNGKKITGKAYLYLSNSESISFGIKGGLKKGMAKTIPERVETNRR